MSTLSLIVSSVLICIPIFISYKEDLGLGKDILISMVRAIIQLVIVGYILQFVFSLENPIFTILLVTLMIINAALNTKKRSENIKSPVRTSFISLFSGAFITLSILILSGAINFIPNEIVPVAGMVVSNSMVAINLSYKNLNTTFSSKRNEVEVKLALGATAKVASKEILKDSIKLSIMPSIDSAKTLGID